MLSYHWETWATIGTFGDGFVLCRAGTLEENDKFLPDAHFFVRSKHPWIIIPAGVRSIETLPGPEDSPLFSGEAKSRMDVVLKASSSKYRFFCAVAQLLVIGAVFEDLRWEI